MKKILLLTFSISFMNISYADSCDGRSGNFNICASNLIQALQSISKVNMSSPVEECEAIVPSFSVFEKVKILQSPMLPVVKHEDKSFKLLPLDQKFKGKGADCSNFIKNSSGKAEYGPWGAEIVKYLKSQPNSILYSNELNGMKVTPNICPSWEKFSKEQKEHFWVWVFASIAHDESTCKPDARNPKATNSVGVGLLQLEEPLSARRFRGGNCKAPSVNDPANNLKCGLTIMEELMKGSKGMHKGPGLIFGSSGRNTSYWEKLKQPGGAGVGALIKTYPLCRN